MNSMSGSGRVFVEEARGIHARFLMVVKKGLDPAHLGARMNDLVLMEYGYQPVHSTPQLDINPLDLGVPAEVADQFEVHLVHAMPGRGLN